MADRLVFARRLVGDAGWASVSHDSGFMTSPCTAIALAGRQGESREEHLPLAKQRALIYVDMGEFAHAVPGLRADFAGTRSQKEWCPHPSAGGDRCGAWPWLAGADRLDRGAVLKRGLLCAVKRFLRLLPATSASRSATLRDE